MKTNDIIGLMTAKVKAALLKHAEQIENPLSLENAQAVIKIIAQTVAIAVRVLNQLP